MKLFCKVRRCQLVKDAFVLRLILVGGIFCFNEYTCLMHKTHTGEKKVTELLSFMLNEADIESEQKFRFYSKMAYEIFKAKCIRFMRCSFPFQHLQDVHF